jgi:hypothetical protein
MLKSADQVLKIIEMVDSPWFGAINDTGSYMTSDPYADMARVVPYTVNWQVKQRLEGKQGSTPMESSTTRIAARSLCPAAMPTC